MLFQNLTVPGFIYLLGFVFLIQAYIHFNLWLCLKKGKDYLFYIGIAVIVISFILGLLFHLTEQELKTIILKSNFESVKKSDVPEQEYSSVYGVLIMIRHLILSITFLIFSLSKSMRKRGIALKSKGLYILIYLALYLMLVLSYFKIRGIISEWSCGKPFPIGCIIGVFAMFFIISLISILIIPRHKNK
jgi:hypothetical protein